MLYSLENLHDKVFDILRMPHETITDPSCFIDYERCRGPNDLEYLAAVEITVEEDGEIAALLADNIPRSFEIARYLYTQQFETELVLSFLQAGELRKLRNARRSGRMPDIYHQGCAGEFRELVTPAFDIGE
jgi:hypothetical protein